MSLSQDSLLEITRTSATAIAERVTRGEISAAEVTDAHIRRIEAVNPQLNAVIVERFAEARAEAEALDQARREGRPLGPLAGVPMTVKETFHLAGTSVTMGVPGLARPVDREDSPLVARLKAAGAIILGKTNVPQLMLMHETDNPIFGRTLNPWNPDRGPGGSSGGEAAIVAAGGSMIGLASDLGGSIRQPAHSCGIHGLKPTTGRLTGMGSEVNLHGMETIGLQSGPLARTVEDLALAMRILAAPGQEKFDPQTPPVAWPDPAKVSVASLRIGYWADDGYFTPSPAIRRAVLEAVEALREQGATVEKFDPPDVAHAMRLYFGLMSADGGADARRLLANAQQDPQVRRLLKLGGFPRWSRTALAWILTTFGQNSQARMILATGSVSADRYWQMTYEARTYVRKFLAMLDAGGFDALVFPPHALPAFKHGSFTDLPMASSYCMLPNLWGVPAGVVAATRVRPGEETDRPESHDNVQRAARNIEIGSTGLPVGVQVAARHWREDIVLSLMSALEHHFRQQADYPERP
jgi:fatty acid amide hydrolase